MKIHKKHVGIIVAVTACLLLTFFTPLFQKESVRGNFPDTYLVAENKINTAEVWVRHSSGIGIDFFRQHIMLNINGDFYDFYEYKGEENLDKNPLEFFMNYHGGIKNGATFSIFSLDLEEKEILDMKNHLEYFVTHEDELPEYWASSNNCSDFLSENILNTFGDFNLSTKGITTPNIIAKQLFKHKKVNGIYGGYVKDSVFHTVKTSPSNIYTKHLQLVTDARDKDFLSY